MTDSVPDFAFDAERGLSYKSFASELMSRVSESLKQETHGTRVGQQTSDGVAALQADIRSDRNTPTGRHVLNMRFALGADDTTYLNSAIAMLFTGTEMDNRQLDLSGLAPPDVQRHIRKAVIAHLQAQQRKRRRDAVRVITALADQVVSYLSLRRVRERLIYAMQILLPDDMQTIEELMDGFMKLDDWSPDEAKRHFKKGAGSKGVYYVLLFLEAALDTKGSIGTAISTVIADMVGRDGYTDHDDYTDHGDEGPISQYERLSTGRVFDVFLHVTSEQVDYLWRRIENSQHANKSAYDDHHPYTTYCIKRGLVGLKGPLHENDTTGVGSVVVPPAFSEFKNVELALTYALPECEMRQTRNVYDPTNIEKDVARTYQSSKSHFKSIVHYAPLKELEGYINEAVDELGGNYALFPKNPASKGIEARFAVRWSPEGDVGEKIAKAAAMEHAAVRCIEMQGIMFAKEDFKLEAVYALMSVGFELRRLHPHASVVKIKRSSHSSGVQHCRLVSAGGAACGAVAVSSSSTCTASPAAASPAAASPAAASPAAASPSAAEPSEEEPSSTSAPAATLEMVWESEAPYRCTTPHAEWGNTKFAVPYDAGYSQIPSNRAGGHSVRESDVVHSRDQLDQLAEHTLSPSTWEDEFNTDYEKFGDISERFQSMLQDPPLEQVDGLPRLPTLPDLFLGPSAAHKYVEGHPGPFCVYEYRSELRDTEDDEHKNLLPSGASAHHLEQLRRPHMHAIVRYALLHSHALHEEECRDGSTDAQTQAMLMEKTNVHKDERSGIWTDMLREVSISNDRLYTFIRTLSGAIGEDVSVLLSTVDETSQRAARALETERKEIAKRVADFQTKIVEIIIGGIVKTSHLEMRPDGSDGEFQVVDAEMAKELRALASGESGRPFFEANVAVQGMINQARTDKTSLGAVVRGLGGVVSTLYEQLQTELSTTTGVGLGAGGLAMLAQPRNSFMVHLRDDATAAIRVAYDRFSREFRGRSIRLYELVEGCDPHLSLRFAEFVGHVLIQVRSSSGATALYVSEGTRRQTALQTRASLMRLTNRASEYVRFAPTPNFHGASATSASAAGIQNARMAYFGNAVPGHGESGGAYQKLYVARVEGRSDTEGGWQGGYHLPYSSGVRYHPYAKTPDA